MRPRQRWRPRRAARCHKHPPSGRQRPVRKPPWAPHAGPRPRRGCGMHQAPARFDRPTPDHRPAGHETDSHAASAARRRRIAHGRCPGRQRPWRRARLRSALRSGCAPRPGAVCAPDRCWRRSLAAAPCRYRWGVCVRLRCGWCNRNSCCATGRATPAARPGRWHCPRRWQRGSSRWRVPARDPFEPPPASAAQTDAGRRSAGWAATSFARLYVSIFSYEVNAILRVSLRD